MANYEKVIDHLCMEPVGKPSRNTGPLSTADRASRAKAATRSFAATQRLRRGLLDTKVVQHDSSWAHVARGKIVAVFDTVGEAVAAL